MAREKQGLSEYRTPKNQTGVKYSNGPTNQITDTVVGFQLICALLV